MYEKYNFQMQDGSKVLDCLKKGIRIASQCMDTSVQVQLYVELLNHYIYFYEKGNTVVSIQRMTIEYNLIFFELLFFLIDFYFR